MQVESMGARSTSSVPENDETPPLYILPYDARKCLPSCIEKCYQEGTELNLDDALRKSTVFDKAVLFQFGVPFNHPLFHNREILGFVTYLLIECTIQERIEKSEHLPSPWSVSNRLSSDGKHRINPPLASSMTAKLSSLMTFECCGEEYSVIQYFWLDDFYHSRQCPCPLGFLRQMKEREERQERDRKAYQMRYTAYKQHPPRKASRTRRSGRRF